MPAMSSLAAGTPTTESAAPAPCIEIHSALAEIGAELIKMPAFICVFAVKCGQNMGFYGQKLEKNGGFVTEIGGDGGDAKRQGKHHVFDFGTLFVVRVCLCI